jgi:F-box-like
MEGLRQLPSEILFNIFQFTDNAALKSLRLCSRRFRGIASPVLFRTVNASPHEIDLEVLVLIAEDPTLCHFVRTIVYYEVYFHLSEFVLIPEDPEPMYNVSQIPEDHPLRTSALNDPTLQLDKHVEYIAHALSRMPRVREVIFKNHWLPLQDDDGSGLGEISGVRGPRSSRNYPIGAHKPYGLTVERSASYLPSHEPSKYDYGLGVMCRALSKSERSIEKFSVDYIYKSSGAIAFRYLPGGFYSDTFLSMSPDDLAHACNAFRHLRKISLSCAYQTEDANKCNLKDSMARMLAAAKDLEELTIDFNEGHFHYPLTAVLGSHAWPRLRLLDIHNKAVHEEEFVDLVYRHRQTLKCLRFSWIYFVHGSWWTWADHLRSWGPSSSIEQMEFGCLNYLDRKEFYGVPGCCLVHYIFGGGLKCDSPYCHASIVQNQWRELMSKEDVIRMFGEP